MSVTINTTIKQIPKYLEEIISLYTLYSDMECTQENLNTPRSIFLKEMTEIYEIGADKHYAYNFINYPIKPISFKEDNSVIVCCSGGKDSVALAIKLKKQGYHVILYFVKGANKSYPEEAQRIPEIAQYLNVPYYIEERFKFSGKSDFPDNPVKDQLISAMALNYAYEIGCNCNVAFGTTINNDSVTKNSFLTAWSDTLEMQRAFETFIRHYIPKFNYIIDLDTELETIDIINKNYNILELTQSCVMPYRFRNKLKAINEEKYEIILPEHRCGSCQKCCREYIHFYLAGRYPLNRSFYKHCLDVFKTSYKKEHPNNKNPSEKTIFEQYVIVPFEEMKKRGAI